jgi:hypothetical protein
VIVSVFQPAARGATGRARRRLRGAAAARATAGDGSRQTLRMDPQVRSGTLEPAWGDCFLVPGISGHR